MTTIIFTEYPPCDLNGSHYATVYCPSCEESFCVDCSKLIHQRKKNRSHEPEEIQLQEPEPEEVPCDSDPSHIAVMYCEDCEENFCADCDYTFHSRKKTALHLRYEGARTPEVVEALKREAEAAAAEQARGTQTVTQTLQKTTINEAEDEEEEAEEGEEDEEEKEQQQEDHSDFNTESDDSDSDTSPASSAAPAAAVTAAAPAAARQASAGVQASTVASSSPASATKSVATPAPSVSASASYAAIAAAGKNPTTTSPQQPMTAKKPTASSSASSSSSSSATATSSASPTSSISSSSPTSHPVKLRKLCKVIAKEGHPSDELIASYKSAWNEMKARLCRKTYNVGHWLGLTTEDRKELAQTLCKELLFNPKPSPTRTIAWSATSFWTTYEIDVICEKTSVDAKSRTKLTTYKVHVDDHGRLENFELTTDGVADGGCNIM